MKNSHKTLIIGLLLFSGLCGFIFSFYTHNDEPSHIRETQVTHSPVTFVQQIKSDPDAGRKIFKEFCAACHAKKPLVDIDAPLIGEKKAWQKRNETGMTALLKTTLDGIGAMPARGGCFECSDDQLVEAIKYILKQSGIKASIKTH
jgi:cytochrome c5